MSVYLILFQMHSLRTAIVVTTCSTIVDLATHTGKRLGLDTIMSESLLSNLIKVASQTKKICCSAAQSALAAVLKYTSYHPVRVLHTLFASLGEKNLNTRVCAITCIQIIAEIGSGMFRVTSLNGGSSTEFRDGLDPNGMDVLEKSLKKGLVDASAAVRDISRETFLLYEMMWPEKGLR